MQAIKTGAVDAAPVWFHEAWLLRHLLLVIVVALVVVVAVVVVVASASAGRADPPNDASSRNLKQRPIFWGPHPVSVCSVVSHRTVVSDPSATVGSESDVERTIERRLALSGTRYERLVTRLVTGEIHDLE